MAKDRLKNNQQRSARLRKENLLWGQNDARIQILDRLWHVTMAAMACYVAQRDHFSSREWWKNHVGFRVKEDAGYSWNRTIESFVKFGWIVLSFSMLETAFRNMLYAIEGKKPSNEFYKVYKQLLDATAVNPSDEQKSAVRLFQLTRNTVRWTQRIGQVAKIVNCS